MGRKAKYYTSAEREAGRVSVRIKYNSTARAKVLRKAQNARAYKRKRSLSVNSSIVAVDGEKSQPRPTFRRLPKIPKDMLALGKNPLPRNTLVYRQFARSRDHNYTEFERWLKPPPYNFTSAHMTLGVSETVLAVHGHRSRLQFEFETARLQHYRRISHQGFIDDVYEDITQRLEEWALVTKWLADSEEEGHQLDPNDVNDSDIIHGMNSIMGETYRYWVARRMVGLLDDWVALKRGRDMFMSQYGDRWGAPL